MSALIRIIDSLPEAVKVALVLGMIAASGLPW